MAKYDNNQFQDWSSALPTPVQPTLEPKAYGSVPYVNTGIFGPEKQAAVSIVAGLKEQLGYGEIARKNQQGPPSFKDILIPAKKVLGLVHNVVTAPIRVGTEAALSVVQDTQKLADPNAPQSYHSIQVKDPVLKFMLGTDSSGTVTPLGEQVHAMVDSTEGKSFHEKALTAGLFAAGKGVEASGPFFPGVGKLADASGIRPAARAIYNRVFGKSVSPVVSWAEGMGSTGGKIAGTEADVAPAGAVSPDYLPTQIKQATIGQAKMYGMIIKDSPNMSSQIYQSGGKLTLETAKHMVNDVSTMIESAHPGTGLAQRFIDSVDLSGATPESIYQSALKVSPKTPLPISAGGLGKFAALANKVEPLTGKSAQELAMNLEVWARKTSLEKIAPEITPDKVGLEAYTKALFEKVSDEQALTEMQSFAHGATPEEQLVNMAKAITADRATLSIKNRGIYDVMSQAEVMSKQALKSSEAEARQFAKDAIAQMKREKTLSPDTDTTVLENRLYGNRLREIQDGITKTPETQQIFDANDTTGNVIGGGEFNPIPVKIIDPVKRTAAEKWVMKNATANTHINDEFFNQFPEYRAYADQIYKASDYNPETGTINPTKFQDAVKNVEERFTYHFREGTQGFADEQIAREQGYLVGQAPSRLKGGAEKTYTARISEGVPFDVRNQKMSAVGRFLTKAGLSPVGIERGTVAQAQVAKFQEYLRGFRTNELDVEGAYTALRKLAYDKMAISESKFGMAHRAEGIFSLSVKDIEQGIGVSTEVAKIYRSAIQQSRKIPVSIQGLGPAAVNQLRSMPVIGPVMSTSIYLTNLGHFTISPAHATRYVTKSGLFSLGEGAGVNLGRPGAIIRKLSPEINLPNIFGGEKYNLPTLRNLIGEEASPNTLMMIEDAFYSKKGLEALDAVNDSDLVSSGAFKGAAKTRNHNVFLEGIKYDERQTTANIFYSIGKRNGLKGNIDEVVGQVLSNEKLLAQASDVAEGIVGYKSGYLQSPLAKTLNIIWYPTRFDTKVAMLTSDFIGRQNPLVQKSIIQGTMNMVEWSQSDGGKQWIKDNDAIVKLFNNLIPYGSIAEAIGATSKGEFTDIGLVGGLPFGFIQSILTQEGVIKNDYINPKTDKQSFQTIPTALSEEAALAVSGLLRHFFPLPIYTFSLQNIHDQDVRPFLYPDMYRGLLGQKKYQPGTPNPYNKPRPDQLFPFKDDDTTSERAWKSFLQGFLKEKEETP